MDKDRVKEVYQIDLNGSPTKMVVLSAKNNDMLAQMFKASANLLAKSPPKTKLSGQKENFHISTKKDNQVSSLISSQEKKQTPSKKLSSSSATFQVKIIQASEISPNTSLMKRQATWMSLFEEKQRENSIAHKYLQKALKREVERNLSMNQLQDHQQSINENSITNSMAKSNEKLQQLKETNEKLRQMKESFIKDKIALDQKSQEIQKQIKQQSSQKVTQSCDQFSFRTMFFEDEAQELRIVPQRVETTESSQQVSIKKNKKYIKNWKEMTHYRNKSGTTYQKEQNPQKKNVSPLQKYQKLSSSYQKQTKSSNQNKASKIVSKEYELKETGKSDFETIEEQAIESNNQVTLTSQLNIIKSKVNKYLKEINFKTIIHLKSQLEPSKSCYRAAKCLCLLLEAMNRNQGQKTSFNDWASIKTYIVNNQSKIMQDIYIMKQKCDIRDYRLDLIMEIYKDIFLNDNCQVEISSPKIRNIQYKPIFCLCFFIINQIIITEQLEKTKILQQNKQRRIQSKATISSELRKSTVASLNTSKSSIVMKQKLTKTVKKIPIKRASETVKQQAPIKVTTKPGVVSQRESLTSIKYDPKPAPKSRAYRYNHTKSLSMQTSNTNRKKILENKESKIEQEVVQDYEQSIFNNQFSNNHSEVSNNEISILNMTMQDIIDIEQEKDIESINIPVQVALKNTIQAKPEQLFSFTCSPSENIALRQGGCVNAKHVQQISLDQKHLAKIEKLVCEFQQRNNSVALSQRKEKDETIRKLKEQRMNSCERKRGKQLDKFTWDLIKEISQKLQE